MLDLNDVCLAIATFRNDDEVIALIDAVTNDDGRTPFAKIIVVDSMGTGRIPRWLADQERDDVEYHSFDENLGSAGNLHQRLRLAAQTEASYCYGINHDGEVDLQVVETLRQHATAHPSVGVVYPLRFRPNRGGAWDRSGKHRFALPFTGSRERPDASHLLEEVTWASSNGALYALAPVRAGINVWIELWHGWEDLEYGMRLKQKGYKQLRCMDAVFVDHYEYREFKVLGRSFFISDKPAWYVYYFARNLIAATKRNNPDPLSLSILTLRLAQEALVTAALRRDKQQRAELLLRGIVDGIRGKMGKRAFP
jgi:GT2 family glycosyltransferase